LEAERNIERDRRGIEVLTYADVSEVLTDLRCGGPTQQLTLAKRDVVFVGIGVLASTVASIWSLWA
jgi:hypothetical protein